MMMTSGSVAATGHAKGRTLSALISLDILSATPDLTSEVPLSSRGTKRVVDRQQIFYNYVCICALEVVSELLSSAAPVLNAAVIVSRSPMLS